ncbi:hypothetical protein M0805_009577 [Coniferiporia weirii]|nr:hypothetical protein M0805_009577 [Coniferiporia weirii]
MSAYDDMPRLVDSRNGPNPWHTAPPAPSPWFGGDSTPAPGGFGAGIPQQPGNSNGNPGAFSPARSAYGLPQSASANNPWHSAPLAGQPSPHSPFSMPAAAFDSPSGFAPGAPGFTPWAPEQPMPATTPSQRPQTTPWYTPHSQHTDLEDGFGFGDGGFENGWSGEQGSDAWGFGKVGTGGGSPQALATSYASGPRHQYKRPEDWRSDFSMPRPKTLSRLLSIGKGSKDSFRSMLGKPSLHFTLDAKSASCSWDVRRSPDSFLVLPEQRSLSYLELQEGALSPPPVRMKLTHPLLPWTVHVAAGPNEVVTVAHLLWTLHGELNRQVFQRDFWNDDVGEEDRKIIYAAWEARCAGDPALAGQGIKRVDFLGDRWVFEGLKRVGEGWEMKLKPGRGRV